MTQQQFNFIRFKLALPPASFIPRQTFKSIGRRGNRARTISFIAAAILLLMGLVPQARASFPVSATLNSSDTQPLSWIGTALGPTSAASTPTVCREGIDCDTFILTIGGTTSDWTGKVIRIRVDWQLAASDFDLYVLKETTGAPVVITKSTQSRSSALTHEFLMLNPGNIGTGRFLVRVMYTAANFEDQYRAVANVVSLLKQNGQIAFTRSLDGGTTSQIYSINPDGTGIAQLTTEGSNTLPAYSPDGTKIAFFSYRDRAYSLYVMDSNGLNQTRLATIASSNGAAPVWSPDGKKILFNGVIAHDYEIYVVNADGSGPLRDLSLNPADDYNASWSPDGSRIVFVSTRSGTNRAIYAMDSEGGNQTQLTSPSFGGDDLPAYSPDGSKIAFISLRTGGYEVYAMNPDGTNQTQLTNDIEQEWHFSWSPDGTKIAYERDSSLYVMRADGSNQTKLTIEPSTDWQPVWSPDASKIAFKTFHFDLEGIFLMNADGSNQIQLTSNGYDDHFSWQSQ